MQVDQGTGWPQGPTGPQGIVGPGGPTGALGGPTGPAGPIGPPALWIPSDHGFIDWNGDPLYTVALATTAPAYAAMNMQRFNAKFGGTVSALYFVMGSTAGSTLTAPTTTTVTGATNNGSGAIRLQVTSSAAFASGQVAVVQAVTGTTEANGSWAITVVDGTHIDLIGSAFVNAYVSGGTFTVSSNCVAIYSASGALLAASIDMSAAWASSTNGCLRHPLANPVVTVVGASYWVAIVANVASPPTGLPLFQRFSTQFATNASSNAFRNTGASLIFGIVQSPSGLLLPSFNPATDITMAPYPLANGGFINGTSIFVATGP